MADADLENVRITDAGIVPETTLADTDVARSIVDRDVHVDGVRLEQSLISAHTELRALAVADD